MTIISSEEIERLVEGLLPPPAAQALREQAERDGRFLKEIVKDALYKQAAEAVVERERVAGRLPQSMR
jgi:hypothetical protein